jgi:hypothetical protein
MALDPHVDSKLKKQLAGLGSAGYSVAGAAATITGSLSAAQLEDLFHSAAQVRYEVVVASGVVTVQPRS